MKKYWIGAIILIILAAIPVTAYPHEWTFMVYLDGDNNLEEYGIDDFLEMAAVANSTDVNIVVQFDRITGYATTYENWTTCHRFKITYNMDPTPANAIADWGDGSGGREVNMGDPDTLSDFVDWATTNYPATRYALILWNHGSGWRDAMKAKGLDKEAIKAVCWDDSSASDCLYMSEVKSALIDMSERPDLIGFDACLMGMIEVAYHIYSYGSVMVASEASEPGDGWPYTEILTALVTTPSMTPSALGTRIVNDYIAQTTAAYKTQAAIDLTKISALASAVDSFAQALGYDSAIVNASTYVEYYDDPAHIDLYDFARLCQFYSSNSTIDSRAQTVMDNISTSGVIIAEGHGTTHPDSHGLAIYFPYTEGDYDSNYESASVNPFSSTHWDEFLHNYYNQVAPPGGDGGTTTGTGGGGSSGGTVCFIATSAYSRCTDSHGLKSRISTDNPVTILCKFRDEYLLTNAPGRVLVSCYERISPPIARYIEDKEALKAIIRFYLKPVVWIIREEIIKEGKGNEEFKKRVD